jgi:S1-C subfamily serine protease
LFGAGGVAPISAQQNAAEILAAIVKIRAKVPVAARTANILGSEREGHGIIIDSDGLILTIGYLILEAESIEVVSQEGKTTGAAHVAYDHRTGFGLIRAKETLGQTPMKLGQSKQVKFGDPLLVAGHAGPELVQGVRVVFRGEFAGYWEYLLENAIYTSPPYSHFGGAALIGPDGHLLGIGSIFTKKTIPGVGSIPCNMFVPIELLRPILEDLITDGHSREPPQPWLGVFVDETQGRVFVRSVISGGPSERAGLQSGDIILTVKNQRIKGLADFFRKVWSLGPAGVDIPLSVLQNIKIRDIVVHSSDRNQYITTSPRN